jgi:hypothetical protein
MTRERWIEIKNTFLIGHLFAYTDPGLIEAMCAEVEEAFGFDKEVEDGPKYSPAFERFWRFYPRHSAKAAAFKAWKKLNPSLELQAAIIDAIDRHRRSDQWKRNIIPHAATWLNGARFDDDEGTPAVPPKLQVVL